MRPSLFPESTTDLDALDRDLAAMGVPAIALLKECTCNGRFSYSTLQKAVKSGALKATKRGKWIVRRIDLAAWILEGTNY